MPIKSRTGPPKSRDADGSDTGENECVWMKARVVNFKLCDKAYDCDDCAFDKAMRAAWNQDPENRGEPPSF